MNLPDLYKFMSDSPGLVTITLIAAVASLVVVCNYFCVFVHGWEPHCHACKELDEEFDEREEG